MDNETTDTNTDNKAGSAEIIVGKASALPMRVQGVTLHPKLAAHVLNRPLMAHPSTVQAVMSAAAAGVQPMANGFEPEVIEEFEPEPIGPHIVRIPIQGVLVQYGSSWKHACMDVTGYDDIRMAIDEARANGAVGAVLDIASGGGEVAGCFDLVDYMYSLRGVFPIFAISNDWAYSAAYAIFSAATKGFVSRTGGVGSIAVIASWQSQSVRDAEIGTVREITSGRLKNATSSHHPDLPPEGVATLQAMVNEADVVFVETVARNRGIAAEAVKAMEGGEFFGQAAVTAGLADGIANYETVCELLTNEINPALATTAEGQADGEQEVKITKVPVSSALAMPPGSAAANTGVVLQAEDQPQEPANPAAPAAPAAPDSSNDPKPMLVDGAKVMINAPYSSQHGQMATVVGEPQMTYVYAVRCEGSDVAGSYAENELGQPGQEDPAMSEQNAKALQELEAKLNAESTKRLDAEKRAADLEAQLMDQELTMQGADPKRLAAYRAWVAMDRGTLGVKAAVASHKAKNPDWYAYAKEAPVATQAEQATQETAKAEAPAAAETVKPPIVTQTEPLARLGRPAQEAVEPTTTKSKNYGPARR